MLKNNYIFAIGLVMLLSHVNIIRLLYLKNVFFISFLMLLASLQCSAQTTPIEELVALSEKHPEQALAEIEQQLLSNTIHDINKAKLQSLKADVAFYTDQPELVLPAATIALSSGLLNEKWQVRTLLAKARGHLHMEEYYLFLATANEAVVKSDQYNLTLLKAAAVIERATANAIFENYSKSEQDLIIANRYLKALPDSFNKGAMQERYSGVLGLLGRRDEAIALQQSSIEIFKKIQSLHFLALSYYNLGRVYENSEDFEKAIEYMELSYLTGVKDNNIINQAFALSRLAEYQLKLNQITEAEKTYLKALKAADESPSIMVQFLARNGFALLTCTKSFGLTCQKALNAAITFAEKSNMLADKKLLLEQLAEAYFQEKQYQRAYETLKQSRVEPAIK